MIATTVTVLVVGAGGALGVSRASDATAEHATRGHEGAPAPAATTPVETTVAPSPTPAPVSPVATATPAVAPAPLLPPAVPARANPANAQAAALAQQVALAAGGLALGLQANPDSLAALVPLAAGQAVLDPLLAQFGQALSTIPDLAASLGPLAGDLLGQVDALQLALAPLDAGQIPNLNAVSAAVIGLAAAAGEISTTLGA